MDSGYGEAAKYIGQKGLSLVADKLSGVVGSASIGTEQVDSRANVGGLVFDVDSKRQATVPNMNVVAMALVSETRTGTGFATRVKNLVFKAGFEIGDRYDMIDSNHKLVGCKLERAYKGFEWLYFEFTNMKIAWLGNPDQLDGVDAYYDFDMDEVSERRIPEVEVDLATLVGIYQPLWKGSDYSVSKLNCEDWAKAFMKKARRYEA